MSIPDEPLKYHEKDLLDHAIDQVAAQTSDLTAADLNRVFVAAQVQSGIDKYRATTNTMTGNELKTEEHNSALLGRFMEAEGKKRPSRCHAHAIVAGKHEYAAVLRLVMAKLKIRIDDPDNGCWLPENTAATPHPAMPYAVPHSRIHRFNYFFWIRSRLVSIRHEPLFRQALRDIGTRLQVHKFPEYVMLKKGQGLPNGGRLA